MVAGPGDACRVDAGPPLRPAGHGRFFEHLHGGGRVGDGGDAGRHAGRAVRAGIPGHRDLAIPVRRCPGRHRRHLGVGFPLAGYRRGAGHRRGGDGKREALRVSRVFPQWDALRTDGERPAPQTVGERTAVLLRLVDGPPPWIIAPVSALLRLVPSPDDLRTSMRRIRQGEHSDREAMVSFLAAIGYERMELVEARGQFAVRGGILDVFPAHLDVPVRAEWFGDEIESLREFDPTTQRSTRSIPAALLTSVREAGGNATVLDYLPPSSVLMLDEPDELQRQARTLWEHAAPATLVSWEDLLRRAHATVRLSLSALHAAENVKAEIQMRFTGVEAFGGQMKLLARALEEWQAKGQRIVVATTQAQRMREILTDHGVSALATGESATLPEPGTVAVINAPLSRGFQLDAAALVVVSDSEIVGWRRRRRKLRFREGIRLYSWTDLTTGDLVVHSHH